MLTYNTNSKTGPVCGGRIIFTPSNPHYIYTMKLLRILLILSFIVVTIKANQTTGYIQVKCEPGVSIFLDGNFVGDTEKELGGLIIKDVREGVHSLRAVKKNFQPRIGTIKVTAGKVLVYTVKQFIPEIKITEKGETEQIEIKQKVGTLVIQSLPVECMISIEAIGFINKSKKSDEWIADPIPSGTYSADFEALGKILSHDFEIITGHTRHLLVDFLSGEIKDLSKQVSNLVDNVYKTIKIGDQLWMAENLKVTHYRNGDVIPTGYSNSEWVNLSSDAYAVYDDDPANADTYGNLYNWYAVGDSRGVCPDGWHVPSDYEYTVLIDYLGGESVAGGKMKEVGLDHWNSPNPNAGATNESGFTALPAGYRSSSNGSYDSMGYSGYFWSSSEFSSLGAWLRLLDYGNSNASRNYTNKRYGFSVRCLGD